MNLHIVTGIHCGLNHQARPPSSRHCCHPARLPIPASHPGGTQRQGSPPSSPRRSVPSSSPSAVRAASLSPSPRLSRCVRSPSTFAPCPLHPWQNRKPCLAASALRLRADPRA
uniref:Uncharacterized protein n=1 Tax=Zea mays TaxID=4577 RepID=A0A804MVU7_MAIZE